MHLRRLALFLFAATAAVAVAAEEATTPSFLTHHEVPKKSQLRRSQALEEIEKLEDMNISALAPQRQLDLMESFKDAMVILSHELETVDVSMLNNEEIEEATNYGKHQAHKAIKVVEETIAFIRTILDPKVNETVTEEGKPDSNATETTGTAQESIKPEMKKNETKTTNTSRHRDLKEKKQKRRREAEREARQKKGHTAGNRDFFRHAHSSSEDHFHRNIQDFTEAIFNGKTYSPKMPVHHSRRRARRLAKSRDRRLTQQEKCELLAECALDMNLYDTFVYFYSDDIDPADGSVDDNLVKFDEEDIVTKYDSIQTSAQSIQDYGWSDTRCQSLLQLFHRTIEHGDTPEWQGATVSQVCLAQGTTVFVKFGEIANALVDVSFDEGYSSVAEDEWIADIAEVETMVAEQVAVEAFQCAEELFYNGDRTDDDEAFPFGGCQGAASTCTIDQYVFPVEYDVTTETTDTTTYESIRNRVKCDSGFEITTKEDCIVAGQAVGGILRSGAIQQGDWGHTPCGCFIDRGDGAVHWDSGTTCANNGPDDMTELWDYSVVCLERRNRDDYEVFTHATGCDDRTAITTKEECEEAGQALGGLLNWEDGFTVISDSWGHTPCGCFMDRTRRMIHWDLNRAVCANQDWEYETICKARKSYEKMAAGTTKCGMGYEISTEEECIFAGESLGGDLRYGDTLVTGEWSHVPCGCSVQVSSSDIHFNTGSDCAYGSDFEVVCQTDLNHERLDLGTGCESGYEITTKDECQEAALSLGGDLRDGAVVVGEWHSAPCGCFIEIGSHDIHFDDSGVCGNSGGFDPVCRLQKNYVMQNAKRVDCDPGFEVSQEDCLAAVESLESAAAHLTIWEVVAQAASSGSIIVGTWEHTPCGCFAQHGDQQAHFDTGTTCSNDGGFDPVCLPNPIGEKYKRIQFATACDSGDEIATSEECAMAGQALGGHLRNGAILLVDSTQGVYPCGCFISSYFEIHFNTDSSSCANGSYLNDLVCHQTSDSSSVIARDTHGKLISNDQSGFITMSYEEVQRDGDSCITSELEDLDQSCLDEAGAQNAEYYECRVEKRQTAIEECDRFEPIQTALELVFGKKTSTGYICGIKDAIVNDGSQMPGSCCLDAPYELSGDEWGLPYDCDSSTPCQNPGPYLAGISEDSCSAHGGTWCPAEADCTALRDCVDEMKTTANSENRLAFEEYLDGAPSIDDPTDLNQCGRVRSYFGFDELFINDDQICEDVEQLKYSRDFDFLDEFFNQGSDTDSSGSTGSIDLVLVAPDHSDSESPFNKGHIAWKASNYGLKVVVEGLQYALDWIDKKECPCDPLCFSENLCASIKNVYGGTMRKIVKWAKRFAKLAEHLCSAMSDKPQRVRAEENTEPIYENMQLTADYLVLMRTDILQAVNDLSMERRHLLESGAVTGSVTDGKVERKPCVSSFEVKVEVLKNSNSSGKSLFVLSTLNGSLVDVEFRFSKLGEAKREVPVDFSKTDLQAGKSIIQFGEDVDDATFLIMAASRVNGEEVVNDLISFG